MPSVHNTRDDARRGPRGVNTREASGAYGAAGGLVRVYPATEPDGTGLVWAHGGAFTAGDLDMPEADAVARALADAGTTVISIDYRLAPLDAQWATRSGTEPRGGVHFPAASDDILAAWAWARSHARALGITTLALGGASAGGNLATGAVVRMLRDGTPLPDRVFLAYPTLHAVQPPTPPALAAAIGESGFSADAIRGMYENYLGGPVDGADIAAIPGRATPDELAGFPSVLMINDDLDELRMSGEAFADTLTAAAVPVEMVTEPGTRHGHLNRPDEPAFATSLGRVRAWLTAPASAR